MIMVPREIKVHSICFFIIFLAYNGVQQFVTSFFSGLGRVSVGFWSLILIYASLMVSSFFSGFIVSRVGVKKCLVFSPVFYSLFILVLATQNPFFIYLASLFLGFGASLLWTAQGVFLIRASNGVGYGRNSGFFNTTHRLGSVIGIIIFSLLVVRFSFTESFLIIGFLPLIASVVFLRTKELKSEVVGFSDNFENFKRLITNFYFLRLSLMWLAFALVIASVSGQLPLEMKKIFGLGSIGILGSAFYILSILFSYYFGKTSDIRGRSVFLILAFILVLLGFGLFALQAGLGLNKAFFILSFILVSLGYAIFSPISYAVVGDIANGKNLGHITGLSIVSGNIGWILAFLLGLYFQPIIAYLVSFFTVLLLLIILLPVLKSNISLIKEKISP